ncbi:amidase, partial [Mesorhizobium sp. M7A.F.Ca.CA.001.09.2.1]
DPDVRKNTLAACDVFRSLGATVEEVDLGWGDDVLKAGMAYLEHLFGASLSQLLKEHGKDMTSYARQFAEDGQRSKATDFVGTLEVAARMYQTLGPLLETYDVLICPTNALPAVPAEFDQTTGTVEINGKQVNPSLGWVMTTPFNMMSRCPVLSVPSGRAASGVPTGIQIVGRTYCDADVFRAAVAYETAKGQWYTNAETRPSL